ncbi:MAG: class I SAM-dependent methyltransferase [Cyclobacteriaceae bacterium]|nr:class I SAM-dependent methyltransferase [Cyclobacteriaceae bacterium]
MRQLYYYLKYFLLRVNEHSLHSPLVYDLYTKIIKKNKHSAPDSTIEAFRKELQASRETIQVTDFGTGATRPSERKISSIVSRSASSYRQSNLLVDLGNYFEVRNILELGTSFGLNTQYLSKIHDSRVDTFEGCNNIATVADRFFKKAGRQNISLHLGDLSKTLPEYLQRSLKPDMVYFDANHDYFPTMSYFEMCYSKAHDKSIFIFDDIHWSGGMDKAWNEIKSKPQVTLSLDLFHFGIVLFDPTLLKSDYILEY